jgi:DNA-binding transcriptional regulator YhcF (GntR family)
VRDVVAVLGINPNTVVKAYRELETRRIVNTRQGRGTFVSDLPAGSAAIPAPLARRLRRWVGDARASGLTRDDLAAVFEEALRDAFAEGAA